MTKKITKLMLNGEEYEIREYQAGWQPDPSRTIFYYDFEDSSNRLKDTSWNNNDAISVSNITYWTVWGQTVAQTTWVVPCGININWNISWSIGTGDFTVSFWTYCVDPWNNNCSPAIFSVFYNASPRTWISIFYNPRNAYSQWDAVLWRLTWSNQKAWTRQASTMNNAWHHFVMTRSSWTVTCYLDGVQDVAPYTDNTALPSNNNTQWYLLSRSNEASQSFPSWAKGDKYILENVWRTAQEISDYYNLTKWDYWIS